MSLFVCPSVIFPFLLAIYMTENCNVGFITLTCVVFACWVCWVCVVCIFMCSLVAQNGKHGTAQQHTQLTTPSHSLVGNPLRGWVCVGMFILYTLFFGVAKTKFHGTAKGSGCVPSQTKLNIKQSTLYCRLTRHENIHAIGPKICERIKWKKGKLHTK